MGSITRSFDGGFATMGSKEIPIELADPAVLELYVLHLDQCAEAERASDHYCVSFDQMIENQDRILSGDAQIGFRYAKIMVDESLQGLLPKTEEVTLLMTWKTDTEGRYYECASSNDSLDYAFIRHSSNGQTDYEATFTGSVSCNYCQRTYDDTAQQWTCEYDASMGDPTTEYVSGALAAPFVQASEIGTAFAQELEMSLLIYANFFSQILP
jgi:hypothetical protein